MESFCCSSGETGSLWSIPQQGIQRAYFTSGSWSFHHGRSPVTWIALYSNDVSFSSCYCTTLFNEVKVAVRYWNSSLWYNKFSSSGSFLCAHIQSVCNLHILRWNFASIHKMREISLREPFYRAWARRQNHKRWRYSIRAVCQICLQFVLTARRHCAPRRKNPHIREMFHNDVTLCYFT